MPMMVVEMHLALMVDEQKVELMEMVNVKLMLVVEEVDLMFEYYLVFVEILMVNHLMEIDLDYSALEKVV
jgi:hypothetical protein